ncbi:bifunctional DNA primase/polymerase [Actinomadura violacea]|uniref:Bifunctional DNA primase/polymerase n=1 Tax=Actinomadura violacea TaxID=2819934 RepID=A0ABS3RYB2_9ACTN|nr:bifunctional DNA primase/polymerase [Actinomadura violacea]MBO2460990.1 bifunctional DNA primase/polymerase [Actinomadura violacea]
MTNDAFKANPQPLTFTTIPFQNVEETEPLPGYEEYGLRRGTGKWSKKPSIKGAFTEYEYGSVHTVDDPQGHEVIGYPTDTDVEAVQVGVICSPRSGLLVIDVDDPEAYAETDLGELLPLEEYAYTRRGAGGHIYLDMRHVPTDRWPTQGPIRGGDIKSAGYVAAAGSLHYSGDRYERTGKPVLVANEQEVEALLEAKRESTGSSRPGAYRGDGHGDDDTLARAVYGWVFQGLEDGEIFTLWRELADEIEAPSWPFREGDYRRHLRGARRKYESSQVTAVSDSNISESDDSVVLRERLSESLLTRLDALTRGLLIPRCEVLADAEAIAKKIKGENDPDRWSRDWRRKGVPEGAQAVFTRIASLRADGVTTSPHAEWLKAQDPTGEIREYLSNAEWVMAEVDGVYEVLRDRPLPKSKAEVCVCGTKVVRRNFGGADPDRCVHVGPRWAKEDTMDTVFKAHMHLTSLARQRAWGGSEEPEDRPSRYDGVSYVNRHLRDGRKPMSASQYAEALLELEAAGRIVKIRRARYYRNDHAWQTAPALWADAAEYPHLVKTDLTTPEGVRDFVRVRVGLHLAEHPMPSELAVAA